MSMLPSIVCLKSVKHGGRFLSYHQVHSKDVLYHRSLHFLELQVTDPLAQYDVIPSIREDEDEGESDFVHLKSRYNNKFLVRWSNLTIPLVALADEPNEDETDWGCTLFRPNLVDGDSTKIRLFHVQSRQYAWSYGTDALYIGEPSNGVNPQPAEVFTVIDVTFLHKKMPKNVAFKGDNGKYLGPFLSNGIQYLQFIYDNPSDRKVAHEILSSSGGTITIKSKYYGQFWRLGSDGYIIADVDEPVINDASSLFRVYIIDVNVVKLSNLKSFDYCKRHTESPGKESLLKCIYDNLPGDAYALQVTDLGP